MNKTTDLTWGLYFIKPRYIFTWLKYAVKDTIILFKRIGFLLRHGYCEQSRWETFACFIDQYEDIFNWYLHNRSGDIPMEDIDQNDYQQKNDELYAHMLELLAIMRDDDEWEQAVAAKDEFFDLMKKYFYHFWD